MGKDLTGKTLGLIHAGAWVVATGKRFADEIMPEVTLLHICDDTLQHDFMLAGVGNIPPFNYLRIALYARFLEEGGADAVMLGCSTMNRAAEYAQPMVRVPFLQIDWPMMQKAVQLGKRIGLLATLDTTVPSSTRLLQKAAREAGKEIEITQLFSREAYNALRSGQQEQHDQLLLRIIGESEHQVDAIVLAQISMAALEARVNAAHFRIPVLNSAREGFIRAREVLEGLP
jgi:aspartate/glutamate racemase